MIVIIACLIFLLSIYFFYKAREIKIDKDIKLKELEQYKKLLEKDIKNEQDKVSSLKETNDILNNNIFNLQQEFSLKQENLKNSLELFQNNLKNAKDAYLDTIEKSYNVAEQSYQIKINSLETEGKKVEEDLNKIKASLAAGMLAQLREKEQKEKINFYKITISEKDLEDIKLLNKIKESFNQPIILNKLIWTTYYQKKVSEMCSRILGTSVVCGIYKITNLNTKQCYIGQSVNISDRWKQHCKCGCGIDASATNRLYQDMIKTGIENFSFELMESCKRVELNEKEKFWINMYQSDIYGLNSTKGNK